METPDNPLIDAARGRDPAQTSVRLHAGRPDLGALVKEIKQVVYSRAGALSVTEAIGALEMAKLEIRDEQ